VSGLAGRLILVVEDEPLVALDIAQSFERAGARVITTRVRSDAVAKPREFQRPFSILALATVTAGLYTLS